MSKMALRRDKNNSTNRNRDKFFGWSRPIQAYFGDFHRIFGLYITNRCTSECRHCAVESSPKENSHLNIKYAIENIIKKGNKDILKGIHISGGEPFLFQHDLRLLAQACRRYGLLLGINTNASWAFDYKTASAIIRSLQGITQLIISTDIYHEEFIPLDRVKNAILTGLDNNVIIHISICATDGRSDSFMDRLTSILTHDLLSLVSISVNPIQPIGRAKKLFAVKTSFDTKLPEGRCERLNRPIVMESGAVLACCNSTISSQCKKSPLYIGNIRDSSFTDIYNKADSSNILQALRVFGPSYIVNKFILPRGLFHFLSGIYRVNDICSLCVDIMSNKKVIDAVSAPSVIMSELKELAVARAALLNEPEMLLNMRGISL